MRRIEGHVRGVLSMMVQQKSCKELVPPAVGEKQKIQFDSNHLLHITKRKSIFNHTPVNLDQ
ncbi:MAG TPA: metal-sensing transcriptional repressor [Candidatus Bathyarchaeia archaeon]|nr:metal-sensing transcriptional repressor [Candidatus Bathyarchaeia archaeon]